MNSYTREALATQTAPRWPLLYALLLPSTVAFAVAAIVCVMIEHNWPAGSVTGGVAAALWAATWWTGVSEPAVDQARGS